MSPAGAAVSHAEYSEAEPTEPEPGGLIGGQMRFAFEQRVVDIATRQVLDTDGSEINVEPQVFDVLAHLIEHRDRVVPKTELFDSIWGDQFVSESALTSRIQAARRALGDTGADQRIIRTFRGTGYRFVADTAVHDATTAGEPIRPRRPPPARTRLIARDRELSEIADLLDRFRAVTITGPGGVGKTSVALEVARRRWDSGDDVIVVELAPVRTEPALQRAIAVAARIEEDLTHGLDPLVRGLSARSPLVVLDNCEHLIEECSTFVDTILDADPDTLVLATSREPMMVDGEAIVTLAPLADAGPELFVERATALVGNGNALDVVDPRIAEVCRRLDGLPLAIEIAAAQLRHLSLDDVVSHFSHRLDGDTAARPRAGARHETLANTIAWSYNLLDSPAREVFVSCGIFPAYFDLASAIAAHDGTDRTDEVQSAIAELVNKNLLVYDRERGQYRMLETIRRFAADELDRHDKAANTAGRLRHHVRNRAAPNGRAHAWLSARGAAASRDDLDTVKFAFDLSLRTGNVGDAIDIALSMSSLWRNARSCAEGRDWVDRLLQAVLPATDAIWAMILDADIGLGSGEPTRLASSAAAALDLSSQANDPSAESIATIQSALPHLVDGTASPRLGAAIEVATRAAEPALRRVAESFLLVAQLAERPHLETTELLHNIDAASADGYDRYIAIWAAWVHALAKRDGPALRRFLDLQRQNLLQSGLGENWLVTFNTALTLIAEQQPFRRQLQRAADHARLEGRDATPDLVLALAYDAACRNDTTEAAELLAASAPALLGDTANHIHHWIITTLVVRPALDETSFQAANDRGRALNADDIAARWMAAS